MNSIHNRKKRDAFLAAAGGGGAGWEKAEQKIMSADASTKRFHMLAKKNGDKALLMHMPLDETSYSAQAFLAKTCRPFLAINAWLAAKNISVPKIIAANMKEGFVLMEDLGRIPYDGSLEQMHIAIDILLRLHQSAAPKEITFRENDAAPQQTYPIPIFSPDIFLAEARLLIEWFLPYHHIMIDQQAEQDFDQFWQNSFARASFGAPVILLRDYHSPNLLFLPERSAHCRLGVLDHQDALLGPPAYDLVSLLQDARITITPEQEEKALRYYLARSGVNEKTFRESYALLGAQRAAKILGIFVRFARQDHKPSYLRHQPRVIDYLKRNLKHPALAFLTGWINQNAGGRI